MATSSITKEFFVKDDTAFEKLKKELDTEPMYFIEYVKGK